MSEKIEKQERALKVLKALGSQLLKDFEAEETHEVCYSVSVVESGKGLEHIIAGVRLILKGEGANDAA